MMNIKPSFINSEWLFSYAARDVLSALLVRGHKKRRPFAMLERPILPVQISVEEYEYKIFVSGRNAIGKTAMAARLSANQIPAQYCETAGIQVYTVYWPVSVAGSGAVMMFKLQLWDTSHMALQRYDHIAPAVLERVDGIIFTFSFADRSTLEDLPAQMSRVQERDGGTSAHKACRFVVGTKLDVPTLQVSHHEIHQFEETWKIPVLGMSNSPQVAQSEEELKDVAPMLNYMCDELWKRDQVLAGKMAPL